MDTPIGGACIGAEHALPGRRGSDPDATLAQGAVDARVVLRVWPLIGCTRFGKQGLLGRNLITVFFAVNRADEKSSRNTAHARCRRPARRLHQYTRSVAGAARQHARTIMTTTTKAL